MPACEEAARLVVATQTPAGIAPPWRITLTFPAIAASEDVLFLVAGADKVHVVSALERGAGGAYPAGRVRARGSVRFLLSAEAWGGDSPPGNLAPPGNLPGKP
jgi:6-phosphogluconolactonase/glucosamine-6-phosphate isomerase/deaminase